MSITNTLTQLVAGTSSRYADYWSLVDYSFNGTMLTLSAAIARNNIEGTVSDTTVRSHGYPVTFTLKVGSTKGGADLFTKTDSPTAMYGAATLSWGDAAYGNGRKKTIFSNETVQIDLNTTPIVYISFLWDDTTTPASYPWGKSTLSESVNLGASYWKITYNPTAGTITTPTQFVEKGQNATLYSLGSGVVNPNAAGLKFYKSSTEALDAGAEFTPTEDITLTTLWQYRLTYNFGSTYPAGTKLYANGGVSATTGYGTVLTDWTTNTSAAVSTKLAVEKTSVTGTDVYIYRPSDATQKLVALNTSPALTDENITLGKLESIDSNKTYYAVWAANTTQVTFESDNFTKVKSLKWKYSTDSAYTTINKGSLSKFTINALYGSTINFYFEPEDGYEAQYTAENIGTKVINTTSPIKITFTIVGKEVDVKVVYGTYTSVIPTRVGTVLDLSTYATAKKTQTEVGTTTVTFDLSNGGDSNATFKSTNTQTKTQTYTQYEDKVYNWESWKDKNNNIYSTTSIEILPNMVATDDTATLTATYSENYTTRYEVATIDLATYNADISSSFTLEGWYNENGTEKYGEPNSTYSIPLSVSEIESFSFYGYFNTTADPGIYVLENGTWKKIFKVDTSNFLKLI